MSTTERLQPGQPPLRVGEFAGLCGVDPKTVRKWFAAEVVDFVTVPVTEERRIPVDAALRVLRTLRVIT